MQRKINLAFDASLLSNGLNKDASRSGLFFVAFNVFKELVNRDDVVLTLSNSKGNWCAILLFLKKEFPNHTFNALYNSFILFYDRIKQKKEFYKQNNQPLKKCFCQIFRGLLSPINKIIREIREIREINKCDAYLSPMYKSPKGITITSFTILYDLIPKVLKDYHYQKFQAGDWLYDLCESLNKDDYYFAISNATKNCFLEHYHTIDKDKIITTYLACNESFSKRTHQEVEAVKKKYKIPQDKNYVFSLCSLEPRKNLIRVINTFVKFVEKNSIDDLVFVLGGSEWKMFSEQLEEAIDNQKNHRDMILKIGYVDDEDLPSLYSGALWFVYTSMYEGFGLPPLEAMSCGCPVITSNNTSLPEVVGDAGIMIDWDSDEQHIEAYEKYYFNERLRSENSQKGLERAKQFSWKKCVDIMVDTIKAATNQARRTYRNEI